MSMKHAQEFSGQEFPRRGLLADGPDWDPGVDTRRWDASMGPHPLGDEKAELPSMTKQDAADECDINAIMARYEKTGVIPQGSRMYEFGEAISPYSFQESMNAVIQAREDFASLSSRVRARFDNDPAKLFAFLDDPGNRDEAVALGILKEPAPPDPPLEVRIIPDPDAPPPKPV